MDKILTIHRPCIWYFITVGVLPFITSVLFQRLGFKNYWSGTLSYWHCPPRCHDPDDSPETRSPGGSCTGTPVVFIHGVGLNILPYYHFVQEMMAAAPHRTILLVSLPHISMMLHEHVPSSAEFVACISDMLSSWGFASAHFIGHSFGSLPLAWMVRRAPSLVRMATFIDPVCFLIIKPDVCHNFLYKKASTATQLLSQVLIARELFIAYSLSRNFFWFMNLLWPEDVTMPAVVALSGQDEIVPTHSVRRYLTVYKKRHGLDSLKVLWFPDSAHGEHFTPGRQKQRNEILTAALVMESTYQCRGLNRCSSREKRTSSHTCALHDSVRH